MRPPTVKNARDLREIFKDGIAEFLVETMTWKGTEGRTPTRIERINKAKIPVDSKFVNTGFKVTRVVAPVFLERAITNKIKGLDDRVYFRVEFMEFMDTLSTKEAVFPTSVLTDEELGRYTP